MSVATSEHSESDDCMSVASSEHLDSTLVGASDDRLSVTSIDTALVEASSSLASSSRVAQPAQPVPQALK